MGYDIEKEKREAIEAGQRALSSLRTARENLNSAKNWGLVDMFGGGFFSTMLKHSKMDQARQNMEQAKYDLRNFSRELNDVNMACNLNINTGDFLSFADYFFDGFVVDWMVQDRINNAKRQVEEAIRRESIMQNDRWKKQSEEQNLLLVSYSVCKIKAVNHKRFAALNIVISAFPFLHSVVRYLTPVRLQSYRPRDLVSLLPEKFHPVFY